MKHELNFTIAKQVSCDSILLFDTSKYLSIEPTNPVLSITVPNSSTVITMPFNLGQATNITTDHVRLMSGVYNLKLSVCPNETLFIEKAIHEKLLQLQLLGDENLISHLHTSSALYAS